MRESDGTDGTAPKRSRSAGDRGRPRHEHRVCGRHRLPVRGRGRVAERHHAADTSGCTLIPKIEVGSNPTDLTLDQANHTAYVPNFYDDDVSVFHVFDSSGR